VTPKSVRRVSSARSHPPAARSDTGRGCEKPNRRAPYEHPNAATAVGSCRPTFSARPRNGDLEEKIVGVYRATLLAQLAFQAIEQNAAAHTIAERRYWAVPEPDGVMTTRAVEGLVVAVMALQVAFYGTEVAPTRRYPDWAQDKVKEALDSLKGKAA
jgi:hypothetical protein